MKGTKVAMNVNWIEKKISSDYFQEIHVMDFISTIIEYLPSAYNKGQVGGGWWNFPPRREDSIFDDHNHIFRK